MSGSSNVHGVRIAPTSRLIDTLIFNFQHFIKPGTDTGYCKSSSTLFVADITLTLQMRLHCYALFLHKIPGTLQIYSVCTSCSRHISRALVDSPVSFIHDETYSNIFSQLLIRVSSSFTSRSAMRRGHSFGVTRRMATMSKCLVRAYGNRMGSNDWSSAPSSQHRRVICDTSARANIVTHQQQPVHPICNLNIVFSFTHHSHSLLSCTMHFSRPISSNQNPSPRSGSFNVCGCVAKNRHVT
jgi:hypothetical protein